MIGWDRMEERRGGRMVWKGSWAGKGERGVMNNGFYESIVGINGTCC